MYAVSGPSWEAEGLLEEQRKAGQETCKGGTEQWQVWALYSSVIHRVCPSPLVILCPSIVTLFQCFLTPSLSSSYTLSKAHCYDLVWQIHTLCTCTFGYSFLFVWHKRSDSDSEGENPEKKKLQEHLMGEYTSDTPNPRPKHDQSLVVYYACNHGTLLGFGEEK